MRGDQDPVIHRLRTFKNLWRQCAISVSLIQEKEPTTRGKRTPQAVCGAPSLSRASTLQMQSESLARALPFKEAPVGGFAIPGPTSQAVENTRTTARYTETREPPGVLAGRENRVRNQPREKRHHTLVGSRVTPGSVTNRIIIIIHQPLPPPLSLHIAGPLPRYTNTFLGSIA